MKRIEPDTRAEALLEPVQEDLFRGLMRLPPGPELTVCVGEVKGISKLVGHTLVLSEALEGPDPHHPADADNPLPPLDRWRRAMSCVLEAAASLSLSNALRVEPRASWVWVGAMIDLADTAVPRIGLAQPDVASAIATGDPGAVPRAGVVAYRYWREEGDNTLNRLRYLVEGGVVSPREWLQIGAWLFDPQKGPSSELPVQVSRVRTIDVPAELGPWCWRVVQVPESSRGGHVAVEGNGQLDRSWAPGGKALKSLVASTSGCSLTLEPGGPVGTWEVASAQGFGQVMGARGVTFVFHSNGSLEVILADAFVGPLAAVKVAEQVGTSGLARGQWTVAASRRINFHGVASHGLTMHGRDQDRFMMPAQGFGIGEWLKALEEAPWWWEANGDRLILRGAMLGGQIEVRLRRE